MRAPVSPRVMVLTTEFLPFLGGIGATVREFALSATALGAEIEVIAPDYLGEARAQDDARLPFRVTRYRSGTFSRNWARATVDTARKASRRARQEGARLITFDGPSLAAMALVRRMGGHPFDAVIHGSEVLKADKLPLARRLAARTIFGAPDRLYANSLYTRQILLDRVPGVATAAAIHAPLGVNPDWFLPADPDCLARIPGMDRLAGRQIIVCTGRITTRKGQLDLLRAIRTAPLSEAQRQGIAVVIAGRPDQNAPAYVEALQAQAADMGPTQVLISGDFDDAALRALYARAALFCLPGAEMPHTVEGFGLVFLEAGAQGLPAVAGAVGGVPEAVLDGETGRLVPPGNPEALGAALAGMLAEPETRTALGARAKDHAESFTWKGFAQTLLAPS